MKKKTNYLYVVCLCTILGLFIWIIPFYTYPQLIENEEERNTNVEIKNKEPIKVEETYSVPLLIIAITGVFIAIMVIVVEPRLRNKEIIDYACEGLLEALDETKSDFDKSKKKFTLIDVKDRDEIVKTSYVNVYSDTHPYNVIFNSSFYLFCPKTQNKLSYLHRLILFNNGLLDKIARVKDLDYCIRGNTGKMYNERIFIYEERIANIQQSIIETCKQVIEIINIEKKSTFIKYFRRSNCKFVEETLENFK